MRSEEIIQCLRANMPAIERLGVASLKLFGSHSRGDARPDSDIDLLVAFAESATFDRYMDLKLLLERLLGRPVDLVTQTAVTPRLRPKIERDAVLVA
jgi:uncharacterized protein